MPKITLTNISLKDYKQTDRVAELKKAYINSGME